MSVSLKLAPEKERLDSRFHCLPIMFACVINCDCLILKCSSLLARSLKVTVFLRDFRLATSGITVSVSMRFPPSEMLVLVLPEVVAEAKGELSIIKAKEAQSNSSVRTDGQ